MAAQHLLAILQNAQFEQRLREEVIGTGVELAVRGRQLVLKTQAIWI